MTHVPYRGTALAVTDLLAGQVTMVFADPVSALPHMKSGAPIAPDVPTIAESGYPGFDAIAWHGILAPANTPKPVIGKLHDQIAAALKDPATKALLEAQAMQTVGDTPEHFAAFIKQDIAVWKAVAAQADVSVK
jgi:tripartite-type tricarboxylate transporter receptor subunit TctC